MSRYVTITPIVVSIPGMALFALEKEAEVGRIANQRMHEFRVQNPKSTPAQDYAIYKQEYGEISHENAHIQVALFQ